MGLSHIYKQRVFGHGVKGEDFGIKADLTSNLSFALTRCMTVGVFTKTLHLTLFMYITQVITLSSWVGCVIRPASHYGISWKSEHCFLHSVCSITLESFMFLYSLLCPVPFISCPLLSCAGLEALGEDGSPLFDSFIPGVSQQKYVEKKEEREEHELQTW